MGKLSMKFSGEDGDTNRGLDLSSLENNPNYKPEPTDPVEPTEPIEPTEPTEPVEPIEPIEPTDPVEPTEPIEPTEPTEPINPEPTEPTVVTDEQIFKNLSEKLGREITSFEDLTPASIEIDPDVKAINEWKEKTGRPLEEFFKYQKDYKEVSDLEIAREFLQIEYPELTSDEIELELEQFIPDDADLDNEAAKKRIALKKYASKGRAKFEEFKVELSKPSANTMTPEIRTKVEFAENIQKQIQDNQKSTQAYNEAITQKALSTESLKLKVSDDMELDFKISEQERKEIPSFINDMPHWKNEDGEWNHEAVIKDAIIIKNYEKMLKLAYEQGVSSGIEQPLKDAKNTTLGDRKTMNSDQGQGKKKPVIEDIDSILGKQGLRLKFGN